MGKYLVAGRAGTGKSAICHELQALGYNAIDTDKIPGLPRWEDAVTKKPIVVKDVTFVDRTKVEWNWNDQKLRRLLDEHEDLIVCGSADNDQSFFRLFDKIFVLTVDPELHTKRLQERTNNYGSHPDMIPIILTEQQHFVHTARGLGAIEINTNRPISEVTRAILAQL